MKQQSLYLPNLNWELTVYYDTHATDAERILNTLDQAGADDDTYFLAKTNLEHSIPNTGLTYSNPRTRETIIVISATTSRAEFANTWLHELIHCATHIANTTNQIANPETIAYIGGDLAMAMQPVAAHLMCPCCNE